MKNVLVFVVEGAARGVGAARVAIELRWVREIGTLGTLTTVPTAPDVVAGVVAFGGAIVPVVAPGPLLHALGLAAATARPPRAGDALILVDGDGTRFAVAVDRVDAITTLDEEGAGLQDKDGRPVPLLDPLGALATARARIAEAAERASAHLAGRA